LAPRTLALSIDDGWDDGYVYALPALQQVGYRATYYVIGRRIGARSFLSGAQLRALMAAGMEVGDHTFDHIGLPALSGTRQRYEIDAAASRIADVLGHSPVTFSYPAGEFDPVVEEAVQAAGFGLAVTTEEGAVQTWPGRFSAPRVRVSPSMSPTTLVGTLERWA
jgi:peptidoglycan/xylan/chitin deacetylase (PgdA/CDA1 family)